MDQTHHVRRHVVFVPQKGADAHPLGHGDVVRADGAGALVGEFDGRIDFVDGEEGVQTAAGDADVGQGVFGPEDVDDGFRRSGLAMDHRRDAGGQGAKGLRQGGNAFAREPGRKRGAGVQGLELREREVGHVGRGAESRRGAVHGFVVDDHQFAVGRGAHVEFDPVREALAGAEGGARVFGKELVSAAVGGDFDAGGLAEGGAGEQDRRGDRPAEAEHQRGCGFQRPSHGGNIPKRRRRRHA